MRNITILHAEDYLLGKNVIFDTNFTNKRILYRMSMGDGIRIFEYDRSVSLEAIKSDRGQTKPVTSEELMEIVAQGDKNFWTWDGFIGMIQGFAGAEAKFRNELSTLKYKISGMLKDGSVQSTDLVELLTYVEKI